MRLRDMRAEYLKRATVESGWLLCHFCRFAEVTCDEVGCDHPLADRVPWEGRIEPGDDCWAFRPGRDYPLDRLDEIVAAWRDDEPEESGQTLGGDE